MIIVEMSVRIKSVARKKKDKTNILPSCNKSIGPTWILVEVEAILIKFLRVGLNEVLVVLVVVLVNNLKLLSI